MSKGVVLITGITGYVATHTALAFFEAGYTVKGTVRSAEKADFWISAFPQHKDAFQYAIVEDMTLPGAYDEAIKGVDIVAHIASPTHWNPKDNEKDILLPAINGTKNILSATKLEPRIKRVVFTSSFAAVSDARKEVSPDKVFTPADFNDITYEEGKTATEHRWTYQASKALAEKTFWNFIKEEKPSWAGSVVAPIGTYGPPLQPVKSLKDINMSCQFFLGLANGTFKNGVPAIGFPFFVDVRDVALAHLRAVELDVAKGQRYLLVGGPYKPEQIVDVVVRNFPFLKEKLPEVDITKVDLESTPFKIDTSKTTGELGITFTPFEKMIVDTMNRLLFLAKQFGAIP
ncbi:NAD P-binding protein [Gloeophyllum trabeum ATCC 11539]|uniref:NAD P-binding protein n=1 Tax=Gloeophyllum trabeum (strain ATCC 11539 / FP-39264 / Madison 617) TaxID=670483 RepID=S7RHY0_GLOTA|nr:NAD P-binding protein [Gloeophyllum trabeum ATCC 11539]EPQ53890.1 NAD P-binding protein [Gloeophyllum trabeum ATCC 11539]